MECESLQHFLIFENFFEPFANPDEVLFNAGDGLGLAIVREIAIIHGGSAQATYHSDGRVQLQIELPQKCQTQGSDSLPNAVTADAAFDFAGFPS